MQRKKFIKAAVVTGLGAVVPVEAMSKIFIQPADNIGVWFDGDPAERFQQLKMLAQQGAMELSIAEFCKGVDTVERLFDKLTFKIKGIKILTSSADTLLITSESRDFLFNANWFKNDKTIVECEFKLRGNKMDILLLCQPDAKPKKLSSISGTIGDLLKPLDFIEVSDTLYVFATEAVIGVNSLRIPQYAGQKLNLQPGINLVALLSLSNSGGILREVVKTIEPVSGSGPFLMCWNMENPTIDFNLQIPQDINIAALFKLQQPNLVIKPVIPVNISIEGILEVHLPGIKVAVPGGFAYSTDGVRGKFNMDKIVSQLSAPLGLPGVHLQTMTLSAGVSNGITVVGAEGKYYIGPNKPADTGRSSAELGGIRSNEFKFVFDTFPGKITPRFVYMYLDKLTLETYIQALTNQNVTLPAFLNDISVNQAMFHWCETPQGELKPDGTLALPIFGMSGIASIFGHRSFAQLQVSAGNQSKGKLIAGPIDIGGGLLKVTGKGQGTPADYKGDVTVPNGGMELMFDSQGPVYLAFSCEIKILGVLGSADGQVRNDGLQATVASKIAGLVQNGVNVSFRGDEFEMGTFINTSIPGMKISLANIGTLNLNTSLVGGFKAYYKNGTYGNSMQLKFDFLGIRFDLGNITTQVSITDLTKVVEKLANIIRDLIVNKFTTDALAFLGAAINKVIDFVSDGLETVGRALQSTFNKSLEDSARLMRQVGYRVAEIGTALQKGFNATAQEISVALKKVGYLAGDACEVLKDVYKLQQEAAAQVLLAAGYTYKEIGNALKSVYKLGDQAVAAILKILGATATVLVTVLIDVFHYGADQAASTLKTLGYPPDVVGGALNAANFSADVISTVCQNVFGLTKEATKTVLNSIGIPSSIVDNLPSIYIKIRSIYIKNRVFVKL